MPKTSTAAATRRRRAAARSGQAKPELGVAMVGHAFMGRAHANAFRQAGHFFDLPFQVVPRVVVGRERKRAEKARAQLGFLEASDDLNAVLARDDIQLVDVATPNDSHFHIAMAAMLARKHVLCEKPLALTLDQSRQMAAQAGRSRVRTGLWHNYRRSPAASLARRMVERGDIGQVRQVRAVYLQDWLNDPDAPASWRTDKKVCGSGAHGDLNAHLIDMTLFLTGLRFESVVAASQTFTRTRPGDGGRRVPVTVDDATVFLARFKGGAIGTYEATRVAPGRKNFHRIELSGTEGSLAWNFERMNELEVFRFDGPVDSRGFQTVMCMDAVHPYASHWWPDGHILGYEHTFVHHLVDFLTALAERKPFQPDFASGVAVQAVLDAVLQSARDKKWTKVAAGR